MYVFTVFDIIKTSLHGRGCIHYLVWENYETPGSQLSSVTESFLQSGELTQ